METNLLSAGCHFFLIRLAISYSTITYKFIEYRYTLIRFSSLFFSPFYYFQSWNKMITRTLPQTRRKKIFWFYVNMRIPVTQILFLSPKRVTTSPPSYAVIVMNYNNTSIHSRVVNDTFLSVPFDGVILILFFSNFVQTLASNVRK